jgi:formylglycine-generating enzyme required for sulfatase activity
MNSALNLYTVDQGGTAMGTSSVTYFSIPDMTALTTAGTNCGGLGGNFPSSTYSHCAASSTYRNVNNQGWIPVNFANISAGSPFGSLPVDPVNSTSSNLYYTYQTNGSTFRLVATPESQKYAAQLATNPTMFMQGSNTSLNGGNWVLVPGNSTFGTNDFYVMKYDATCSDGNGNNINTLPDGDGYNNGGNSVNPNNCTTANGRQISSLPGGYPIVDISQTQAISYCAAIGAHLITNNEWQTIAWNVESQASNWSGGTVGSGALPIGNAANGSEYPADQNDANGYAGEGSQTYGSLSQKRTLALSDGAVIWDMAGNVWQWTNNTILGTKKPAGSGGTGGWSEWTTVGSYDGTILTQQSAGPAQSSWNSSQGVGQYYEGANDGTSYGFLRGGSWYSGGLDGVEALHLNNIPSSAGISVGFRCAR